MTLLYLVAQIFARAIDEHTGVFLQCLLTAGSANAATYISITDDFDQHNLLLGVLEACMGNVTSSAHPVNL